MRHEQEQLQKCYDKITQLINENAVLETQLKGEKELRKKAEEYTKEVEGYLKETLNKENVHGETKE